MIRLIAAITLAGTLSGRADTPARWQFAGENQGIRFYFKIANECRPSGARVELKLENTLDRPVTVAFRLVDPDWKQSFEREVGPRMKDMAVKFTPEEGSACHPYIDEVYVESKETQVTHADESGSGADSRSMETPAGD
ncbi:MAG TPA: hypothetical protein VJ385_09775 [Fibrobacteria bacterium]|nr:hypothetical protein [Fibrobacteria bacterium]